jgi:hypothetical protein
MLASVRRTFAAVFILFAVPLSAQRFASPFDSVRGRILFNVAEASRDTTAPPVIVIYYQTDYSFGCLLPLSARLTRGPRGFTLDAWAIADVELCATQVGPASGRMALALEPGVQLLTIRHRGVDDHYELDVTTERIRIRALAPPLVSVTADTFPLLRYPRNTFVVTCGADGQPWICDGLFRVVELEAGIEPIRMPRDGRNPFYGGSQPVRSEAMMAATRVFRYRSLADLDHLRASMRQYRDEATGGRNGFTMAGRTWTGVTWW